MSTCWATSNCAITARSAPGLVPTPGMTLFQAGFTEADLQRVLRYLQREIREGRRNVGALKLPNLLQMHRFEEYLNIQVGRFSSKFWVKATTFLEQRALPGRSEFSEFGHCLVSRLVRFLS